MVFDENNHLYTIDGKSLNDIIYGWCSLHASTISGKFNNWQWPTKFPRERWSELFESFASRLIWKKDEEARKILMKSKYLSDNLEKMKYYYGH